MTRKIYCLIFLLHLYLFSIYGQQVELNDLLKEMKAKMVWNPVTETGIIVFNRNKLVFKLGAPWVLLNYRELIPTSGVIRGQGTLLFPVDTVEKIKSAVYQEKISSPRVAVILIDPGHGGKDPGAIGTYKINGKTVKINEKDIVLQAGLMLQQMLSAKYPDKRIIISRSDDTYLKLEERTDLANNIDLEEQEAILFISIHANASFNKKSKGFEVWYLPPEYRRDLLNPDSFEEENREIMPILNILLEEEYTIESVILAKEIIKGFEEEVGGITENRGIKEQSWFVVRKAYMPSVLVELGFVTNREEAMLLRDQGYLQRLIRGMYNGLCRFINNFENTKGFTE